MNTGIRPDAMYQSLATSLRQEIVDGKFQPGQLLASEHELARRQGVSRVTVRRASELLMQEGLLERRPGKGLFVCAPGSATEVQRVQVVAGNLQWEPCLQAARGVQAAARGVGAEVQIYDAHGSESADLDTIRRLPEGSAQGAVIISVHGDDFAEALYSLKVRGFPFVLVDQRLRDLEVPSVVADNADGGMQLAKHLLGLGHRRIAFIGDLVADTVQARLSGLRDAMGDAGLPFDRSLVVDLRPDDRLADWTPQVEGQARALLARPDRPTAVFASCDAVARTVYAAARAEGLRVPADLSVVGFDDDPLAGLLSPPLTTVRQPFAEMGRAAFELLRARIIDPASPVEHRVLPIAPVLRTSAVAPAR